MKTVLIRAYPYDKKLIEDEVTRLRREGKYQVPMPNGADVIAWALRKSLKKSAEIREAATDWHRIENGV